MSTPVIRQSHESDVSQVYELAQNLPPLIPHTMYTYWNLFRNFSDSCFVVVDENKPVGFITSHPTTTPPNEWFIWQVGILPEYRGRGLIDRLQERVITVAKKYGAVAIQTTIESDNPRSIAAFSRMATAMDVPMEEVARFNLTPNGPLAADEILYRFSLEPKNSLDSET